MVVQIGFGTSVRWWIYMLLYIAGVVTKLEAILSIDRVVNTDTIL